MSSETIIRITPDRPEIVIEQVENGVIARKQVTPESLARCFLQSRFDSDAHPTGLLPEGCIAATMEKDSTTYFIRCAELNADFTYFGTEYPNFPIPRLVFAFRYLRDTQKVAGCRLCVVKDEILTPDTPTFYYPFSNVSSGNGGICIGNNALPVYKDPSRLSTLPGYILRMPNNNDHFSRDCNREKLEYRDLLEQMKDKTSASYYADVLVPDGKTLKNFIGGI